MTTGNFALASIAKISLICIWVESVLYGVNCVMYGLCMFILLRDRKVTALPSILVVLSTILFLLCTVHAAATLRQLLEAFVYVPVDVPGYSTAYWLDHAKPMAVVKHYVYDTLMFGQYSILIWRLYVVYMCNWKVTVIPIILVVSHMGILYAISALSSVQFNRLHGPLVSTLTESVWVLDMILNVSVTVAIATRLWWMGRKVAFPTTQSNRYASSAYVIVESGAILLVTNVSMLGLYLTNNPTSITILDVASQLAALAPFLIVVQVALTGRYRIPLDQNSPSVDFSNTAPIVLNEMVFCPGAPEEQKFRQGTHGTSRLSQSSTKNAGYEGRV